ncbi:hypothetical protein AGMMS50256_20880 [Betaproteobacteria bacterium]|nr:hypothetical protein AGMMS50256_20880 [Betaproteobacteria bacterium]
MLSPFHCYRRANENKICRATSGNRRAQNPLGRQKRNAEGQNRITAEIEQNQPTLTKKHLHAKAWKDVKL